MFEFLQKILKPNLGDGDVKPPRVQTPRTEAMCTPADPVACDSLKKQGNAFLAQGQLEAAAVCYRQAGEADPSDVFARINLGFVLFEQGQLVQAQATLRQALRLDPNQHDAHFMLGGLAQKQGDTSQAIVHFEEVLKINPHFELAYRELGYELFRNKQTEASERVMLDGIDRFPDSADLLCNLGSLYSVENLPAKAVPIYEKALVLQPDSAEIVGNLGAAYDALGDGVKAGQLMLRAIELAPGNADLHSNLGTHLWENGMYRDALQRFNTSVDIDPNHGLGHMHVGLSNLLIGDYEKGWLEYEWRFKGAGHLASDLQARKSFPQARWLGAESIDGKTVLLHCEQGYGDTLQFCRYAPEVAARGAVVVLQVQRGLKELLKSLPGVASVVEEGETLPAFDMHCPLMSLPLALGHHKIGITPMKTPYLQAEPERVQYWRQRLAAMGSPQIGVVWSGNPRNARDHRRSMTFSTFAEMLLPGMPVVVLQPELRAADLPAAHADSRLIFPGAELKTFADTAALVTALDLVITVCTSVAHLAGALGKPVWVLVSHVPDWRWQLEGDDSPWYSGAKIFRQAAIHDWSRPVEDVRKALLQRYPASLG